ncbi:MAG: rhodanese-like domain-containing protein [Verrucomicrobia bacterium]|nr:MAG: rhodanese-like domain-containing protein [Verrucomicrobiota bacterium]
MKSLLSIVVAFATVVTAQAGSGRYTDISHDSLKEAIADGTVTLIDVNGTRSYDKGHIPGAIDFQANKADLAGALPADKEALIVAYCANVHCGAYQRAAKVAVDLGYTNVAHYSRGIEGWKEAGESVEKG